MKHRDIDENGILMRWLRSKYGYQDLRAIVMDIARQLLAAGNQRKPPIQLRSLFGSRRIVNYSELTMTTAGRLVVDKNGFNIAVQNGYETRTRFTMAHEIAHTIFYDLEPRTPKRLLHGAMQKEEEYFCNMLAAEILMPSWMLEDKLNECKVFDNTNSPVAGIQQLAGAFKVSIEAMTRKLVTDLEIYKGIVLSCRWLPGIEDSKHPELSWRLWWWAASREASDALYIPPIKRRPKLELDLIEHTFVEHKPMSFEIQLVNIRLGNLKKVLGQALGSKLGIVSGWVHPILPRGLQLDSIVDDLDAEDRFSFAKPPATVDDINTLARERAEILLFFPLPH